MTARIRGWTTRRDALEFDADGRVDLARRQFDCLEYRQPRLNSADNEIECIGEDVQKAALVSFLCEADQEGGSAKRCCTS